MSFPPACCKLAPVQSDYTPKGNIIKIGEVEVYETVDKQPQRILISAYDIFGFHNVTKQVCDKLAEAGFRIVMPDFFRGHHIDPAWLQQSDRTQIYSWIQEHGTWENTVKTDLLAILKHYKDNERIQAFGIFGFCWGARVCIDALTEVPDVQAAGLIHPSLWKTEDANDIKKPTILLPTKDDEDMTQFFEILKKNVGEDKCAHRHFADMHHGFCAARANLDDALNRERVDEAIGLLAAFFDKHVNP